MLRGLTALTAASIAGCTVTTNGSVTTITLNVKAIRTYGVAGLNAVSTVMSIAAVASAVGAPAAAVIAAADTALAGALNAFAAAAGNAVTITYDSTSFKTQVDSLLSALESVASDLSAAITGAGDAIPASARDTVSVVLAALSSVVSIFQGLLGMVSVDAGRPSMPEAQALRTLGVTS
ncbi:hypothetical protein [Ameyamaea chiangmaiensis]|nr:hypothetical protein [Ameyamaea chiangmaiensis]